MKKKETNFTMLKYNPKGNILSISTGQVLLYNFETCKFEVNQNPEGNAQPKPIFNIEIFDREIKFKTVYKGKERKVSFQSNNDTGDVLIELFKDIYNKSFKTDLNKELDNFSLIFKNDNIYQVNFYKKSIDYEMLDSISIINKDDNLYVRRPLKNILNTELITCNMINNELHIKTNDDEDILYTIDSNMTMIYYINKLLKCTKVYKS